MVLTREFKETIRNRAQRDKKFRCQLLTEAIQCLLDGDIEVGKNILRDYINATIGFETLAEEVDKSPKSLMRMFSPQGNPQAQNLFTVIRLLQEQTGVQLKVKGST